MTVLVLSYMLGLTSWKNRTTQVVVILASVLLVGGAVFDPHLYIQSPLVKTSEGDAARAFEL